MNKESVWRGKQKKYRERENIKLAPYVLEVLFMSNRIFSTVYHTVNNLPISMLQVSYLRGLVSQLQEDVCKKNL
jgi:hypothetical protein